MYISPRTAGQALQAIAGAPNFREAIDIVGNTPVLIPWHLDSVAVRVTPDIDCVITPGQPQGMGQPSAYSFVHFQTPSGLRLDQATTLQHLAGVRPAEFASLIQGAVAAAS